MNEKKKIEFLKLLLNDLESLTSDIEDCYYTQTFDLVDLDVLNRVLIYLEMLKQKIGVENE